MGKGSDRMKYCMVDENRQDYPYNKGKEGVYFCLFMEFNLVRLVR